MRVITDAARRLASGSANVIVADGRSNSFPSACRGDNASHIVCLYKEAPYLHVDFQSRLWTRESTDGGVTWGIARPVPVPGIPATMGPQNGEINRLSDGSYLLWVYAINDATTQRYTYAMKGRPGAWGAPVLVSTTHAHAGPAFEMPNGDIIAAGYTFPAAVLTIFRSTDGGATWGSDAGTFDASTESIFTADPDGNFSMWIRMTGVYFYRRRSTNGGLTWAAPTVFTPPGYYSCKPQVSWLPSGKLLCIYRKGTSTDADTWQAISSDGGATWDSSAEVRVGYYMYGSNIATATGAQVIYAHARTTAFNASAAHAVDARSFIFVE